jgi:hypothetical protein
MCKKKQETEMVSCFLWILAPLFLGVFFLELLDSSLGIKDLLFAGEERMTLRADVEMDVFACRARYKGFAARARHFDFLVLRVNACFHVLPPEM